MSDSSAEANAIAASHIATILGDIGGDGSDLESLCRDAIVNYPDIVKAKIVRKHDTEIDRTKFKELVFGPKEISPLHTRNHFLRFGIEDKFAGTDLEQASQSASSKVRRTSIFSSASVGGAYDYDDIIAPEVLSAPICDMCIIHKGDPMPVGFLRVARTLKLKKADLNYGAGGARCYLCIKKDTTGESVPVTGLVVVYPDRKESVPPGYMVLRRNNQPVNINTSSSERVYICMKRDQLANPITDVQVLFPSKGEEVPRSFDLIEFSSSGLGANLNLGTGGNKVMLCYKQPINTLLCLQNDTRPLPRFGSSAGLAPVCEGDCGGEPVGGELQAALGTPDSALSPVTASAYRADSLLTSSPTPVGPGTADSAGPAATRKLSSSPGPGGTNSPTPSVRSVRSSTYETTDAADGFNILASRRRRAREVVVSVDGTIVPRERRLLLWAILTALYTRHGDTAYKAILAVSGLLNNTDFYGDDIGGTPPTGTLTMLDLTVEALCDRCEFCTDSQHDLILPVIKTLIMKSNGSLSHATMRQLYRVLFLLSSYYAARPHWVISHRDVPTLDSGDPIPAVNVMHELLWAVVAKVEDLPTLNSELRLQGSNYSRPVLNAGSETSKWVHGLLWSVIDETIETVEISKLADAAKLLVAKQSASSLQVYFWEPITSLAEKMFEDHYMQCVYASLCAICQMASHKMKAIPTNRDVGVKILALDYMYEFCSGAGEKLRTSKVFGFQLRRLVVPCVLDNVAYAMTDHRIFQKLSRIISVLWKVWRQHVLIEFAMLVEQFVIPILEASIIKVRPDWQLTTVLEVVSWLDQPFNLVEMFVNFDLDNRFLSSWNVFGHLVRAVSTIVRRLGAGVGGAGDSSSASILDHLGVKSTITVQEVNMIALQEMTHLAKVLMDTTGHANIMSHDSDFKAKSMNIGAGWAEDDSSSDEETPAGAGGTTGTAAGGGKKDLNRARRDSFNIKLTRAAHMEAEELVAQADKIYHEKKSLPKAIKFLLANNFMQNTPQEIANFLRVYKGHFDQTALGDFLGEGGVKQAEIEYWNQIRYRYTRAVSFVEMEIEPALRLFLTGCGFRLPGEAQKIERFMEVFATTFWQDNQGTPFCPFSNRDTILIVAYSVIMLNTDLHRANIDTKKRGKRMTRDDFLRNLRGCDDGADIESGYLGRIFDSILVDPIALEVSSSELGGAEAAAQKRNQQLEARSMDISLTAFNQDIHKNVRNANDLLRSLSLYNFGFQVTGVDVNITLDLVSFMFESVWAHFYSITDTLLVSINEDTTITFAALDILCYCLISCVFLNLRFERMQFANQYLKFKVMCNRVFAEGKADGAITGAVATVGSSTDVENARFVKIPNASGSAADGGATMEVDISDETWYEDIENSSPDTASDLVGVIYTMIAIQKEALEKNASFEVMKNVAAKLEKKDSKRVRMRNSHFIREGTLTKQSSTSGRLIEYRFFLFSDHMLYSHYSSITSEYKVHTSLSLIDMEVSDRASEDPSFCSFTVTHPSKSFIIIAENVDLKYAWLSDIERAIQACKAKEKTNKVVVRGSVNTSREAIQL